MKMILNGDGEIHIIYLNLDWKWDVHFEPFGPVITSWYKNKVLFQHAIWNFFQVLKLLNSLNCLFNFIK